MATQIWLRPNRLCEVQSARPLAAVPLPVITFIQITLVFPFPSDDCALVIAAFVIQVPHV